VRTIVALASSVVDSAAHALASVGLSESAWEMPLVKPWEMMALEMPLKLAELVELVQKTGALKLMAVPSALLAFLVAPPKVAAGAALPAVLVKDAASGVAEWPLQELGFEDMASKVSEIAHSRHYRASKAPAREHFCHGCQEIVCCHAATMTTASVATGERMTGPRALPASRGCLLSSSAAGKASAFEFRRPEALFQQKQQSVAQGLSFYRGCLLGSQQERLARPWESQWHLRNLS